MSKRSSKADNNKVEANRVPVPPTVVLRNWVSKDYQEPCSRCGGGHSDRRKFVCSRCNRLYCVGRTRESLGELMHMIAYREPDGIFRTWCGPLDECGVWETIAPKLQAIVNDLS